MNPHDTPSPRATVYIKVHSQCVTSSEFQQKVNDMHLPLLYHTEQFHYPRNPLCTTCSPLPPPVPSPGYQLCFYWVYRFAGSAFSCLLTLSWPLADYKIFLLTPDFKQFDYAVPQHNFVGLVFSVLFLNIYVLKVFIKFGHFSAIISSSIFFLSPLSSLESPATWAWDHLKLFTASYCAVHLFSVLFSLFHFG